MARKPEQMKACSYFSLLFLFLAGNLGTWDQWVALRCLSCLRWSPCNKWRKGQWDTKALCGFGFGKRLRLCLMISLWHALHEKGKNKGCVCMASFHLKRMMGLVCWHGDRKISKQNSIMTIESLKTSASFHLTGGCLDWVEQRTSKHVRGNTSKKKGVNWEWETALPWST